MTKVSVVDMTPKMASALLPRNIDNRYERPSYVDYLVLVIKAGGWYLSNDAIVVDWDGVLRNGQHRLTAISRAGVTCRVLFVEGADPEDRTIYDTGIKRSQADNLSLERSLVTDARQLAFMVGRVKGGRVSEQTIKDIVDWWRPIYDIMRIALEGQKVLRFGMPARVGYGLRAMITDQAQDREHVLDQYVRFMRADVPHMTMATSIMWKRLCAKTVGGSRAAQDEAVLLLFHGSHPQRRVIEPMLRSVPTMRQTLAEIIQNGADAYARGPATDGWPYIFPKIAVPRSATRVDLNKTERARRAALLDQTSLPN